MALGLKTAVRCAVGTAVIAAGSMTMADAVKAATSLRYGPPPAWVQPAAIPLDMPASGAAVDLLLSDQEMRLTPQADVSYVEVAARIAAPEGLVQTGNLIQAWNPEFQTLSIHRLRVLRGGKTIDLLAGGKSFTVLRRETNLEAAAIDGALTATFQPEGLQVGDVLDYAFGIETHEPGLGDHSQAIASLLHLGPAGRVRIRAAWPEGGAMHVWKTDDVASLKPTRDAGWTGVALDAENQVTAQPPAGAPLRDQLRGLVLFSDFTDWAQVSATVYPLFVKAQALAPGSPITGEIARIAAASPDPKARALAALELVEDHIRYLFVGLDAGGYTPAAVDVTWTRRFGDCKAKTVLLLALLHGLNIEAEPALASTTTGDGLDSRPPQMSAFDHVLVKARIAGRTYWLDATRMGDANLDVLTTPDYHWALPLRSAGATLEPLVVEPPTAPLLDKRLRVDLTKGTDADVPAHMEITLRGDEALATDLSLKRLSKTDGDAALRQAYGAADDWMKIDTIAFAYDAVAAVARITLDGSGKPPFADWDGAREWNIGESSLGYDADFRRTSAYHAKAPYAVTYPAYSRWTVEALLPQGGKGFSLINADPITRTTAGVAYARAIAIADGRMTMVASERAVAPQFPAAEASAAQATLRDISAYNMALRYTPIDKAAAQTSDTAPHQPIVLPLDEDAPDPVSQARQAYRQGKYALAVVNFSQAITTTPHDPTLFTDRGVAELAQGQDKAAAADFDAALKLNPHDAYALYAKAQSSLRAGDKAAAYADLDAATRPGGPPEVSGLVFRDDETAGRHAAAAHAVDDVNPDGYPPTQTAEVFNARCWARAEWGQDLDAALKACDAALKLIPRQPDILDSRALVELRLGKTADAVADYDAVLAIRPNAATSLYGRSLAERRLGRVDAADTDLAAAQVADPKVGGEFTAWRVKP